jgi:hypothetical protein
MRTVITISLNGNAYQLDAVGYDALQAYLQVAEQRLAGNPDQEEILADLEQASRSAASADPIEAALGLLPGVPS